MGPRWSENSLPNYLFAAEVGPEWRGLSRADFNHVFLVIDWVQLPHDDGHVEAVLDHEERREGDDLRQAGLAHVVVHTDAVATKNLKKVLRFSASEFVLRHELSPNEENVNANSTDKYKEKLLGRFFF